MQEKIVNNSIIDDLDMLKSRIKDYISINEYNKIKEELYNQIKINEQLNNKINELQNQLLKENFKNNDLRQQISNSIGSNLQNESEKMNESLIKTTNDLYSAKKQIEKLSKALKGLNIEIKNKNLEIQNKEKELIDIYKENRILKKKLSRFPFELEENEVMMIIFFKSSEEQLNQYIICKNTETFSQIELRLKNKIPKLRDEENYYIHEGKKINKNYNLDENGIKDGDIIIINTFN